MAQNTIYVKDCTGGSALDSNPFLQNAYGVVNIVPKITLPAFFPTRQPIEFTATAFYHMYCTYYKPYREIALPTVASFQYEWAELFKENVNRFAELLKIEADRITENMLKDETIQSTYERVYNSTGNDNSLYSDTPNTKIPTRTEEGFATSLDNTDYQKDTTEKFVENQLKVARDILDKCPSFLKEFLGTFECLLYDCYTIKQNILNRKDFLI